MKAWRWRRYRGTRYYNLSLGDPASDAKYVALILDKVGGARDTFGGLYDVMVIPLADGRVTPTVLTVSIGPETPWLTEELVPASVRDALAAAESEWWGERLLRQREQELRLAQRRTADDESDDEELVDAPATRHSPYPVNGGLATSRGPVRSKSEWIIASLLDEAALEWHYERRLYADDGTSLLPDFTIIGDHTVLWEHLGLLTEPAYAANWARKRTWYEDNGWHLGVNLFVSEESAGFDVAAVRAVLQEVLEALSTRGERR